jgi:hypothetical protein
VKTSLSLLRFAALLLLVGASPYLLAAQPCSDMPYLHQNKFDPQPIELQQLSGHAVDQNGHPVTQLCVGLFNTQQHKLVRYAQSDAKGNFTVNTDGLPDGEYRLVGHILGFGPANAIIDIKSRSQHKTLLVVHMNLPTDPNCSLVELSKE